MVVPSSWTIRLTSSLLAGSALSIARDPRKLWRQPLRRVKAGSRLVEGGAAAAGQGAHNLRELRGLDRLGQVDLVARGEHAARVLPVGEAGERGGRDLAPPLRTQRADLADEGVAVLARHADVAHEHVGPLALARLHRLAHRGD